MFLVFVSLFQCQWCISMHLCYGFIVFGIFILNSVIGQQDSNSALK